MILHLQNGYPMPYPSCPREQEAAGEAAPSVIMKLAGVVGFQWLHEVTVEFSSAEAYTFAQSQTEWKVYDATRFVLSAPSSSEEGYDHPAIIAKGKAYCGFMLLSDDPFAGVAAASTDAERLQYLYQRYASSRVLFPGPIATKEKWLAKIDSNIEYARISADFAAPEMITGRMPADERAP